MVDNFESVVEPGNFALIIALSAILVVVTELSAMFAVATNPSCVLEESTTTYAILLFLIA